MAGWDRAILHGEALAQAAVEQARAGVATDASGELLAGCRAAVVLLSAGRREPARSLIRLLSRAAAQATLPEVLGPSLALLAHDFLAWTGDVEFLEKYPVGTGDGGGAAADRRETMGDAALGVIASVVRDSWGIVPAAVEEQLAIALQLPSGASEMALTGVRVGRTTLTLRYRRRPGQVVMRCEITRGSALRLTAVLNGPAGTMQVSVDEVALGGGRAVFEASRGHELVFGFEE